MTRKLKLGWTLSRSIGPNGAVARTLVMTWSLDRTAHLSAAPRYSDLDSAPAHSPRLSVVSSAARKAASRAEDGRETGLLRGVSRWNCLRTIGARAWRQRIA